MRAREESEAQAVDDPYVLQQRPLRQGVSLHTTSRFSDDVWELGPTTLQNQGRVLSLSFTAVPEIHKLAAKRFVYAMLSGMVPEDEIAPRVETIVALYYDLRIFLKWLAQTCPELPLRSVTEKEYTQYHRHLLATRPNPRRRLVLRGAVNALWRYRHAVAEVGLQVDPRDAEAWDEKALPRRYENATDRIPEEVHSHVQLWALRFVRDFSDDIITALRAWNNSRRAPISERITRLPYGSRKAQVRRHLAEKRRTRSPLPGSDGTPNFKAIAYDIGCHPASLAPLHDEILATAEIVGVSEYATLGCAVHGHIDGSPWLEGISLTTGAAHSLSTLTRVLQAACYIVIAFLSGMRDSEIKHLGVGCCSAAQDATGRPYRWTVTSTAFKGESDATGTTATWVVGEAAAQAIRVLEEAHSATPESSPWLFAPLSVGPGRGSARRNGNQALTTAATNKQLAEFVAWVNEYCAAHGRPDAIPEVNGATWRLSTRQFRRTLAWYIARRPGGSIAGAIQYRHHSIQMFEGYAGTSESGFRAEVEAEEALARGEHLFAIVDQHDHSKLTGPASDEARNRLTKFDSQARYKGVVATDRYRLLRLMTRDDPAVYPGRYVTCVYDHRKALCRDRSGAPDEGPNLRACKPLSCGNVALDAGNVEAWREELRLIDNDIAIRPSLPPLLADRLNKRREQIIHLLEKGGVEP